MRIGIDIDGVLTDMSKAVADYGTKFCYDNDVAYTIDLKQYYEDKALGIDGEALEKFWNIYLPKYVMEYQPREFASQIIQKLKENGNDIYLITSRDEEGLPKEYYGRMQEMTKEWLNMNKIIYDKIVFTKGSKLPYCIENKVDVMIEDSPRNLLDISKQIPCLCFEAPYNQDIEMNNITRVYSWYDVLKKIESM